MAYGFGIAAEIALVANFDRKPLAALDILSDICAADGRGKDKLNVSHSQPVPRSFWSIHSTFR